MSEIKEVVETPKKARTNTKKTSVKKTSVKQEDVVATQPSEVDVMKAQMDALMQMMAQQQTAPVQVAAEEPKETRVRKTTGKTKGITKAQLRRKYKDTDVF